MGNGLVRIPIIYGHTNQVPTVNAKQRDSKTFPIILNLDSVETRGMHVDADASSLRVRPYIYASNFQRWYTVTAVISHE
jgi:hypothetical protein